jgi:fibronectin-binding autotransporter adhesin
MVFFSISAQPLKAASITWAGSSGALWDAPANWSPSTTWTAFGNTAVFNSAGASVTVNSVTASAITFSQSATISGGTISLAQSSSDLTNNASGLTTVSSAINLIAPAATIDWTGNSAGTLAIAGPITVATVSNFFLLEGNYDLNPGGSISFAISGAFVMNSNASPTNFLQAGGLMAFTRPGNNALYLTQAGTTNYMVTGGSLIVNSGTTVLADDSSGRFGTLSINGPGATVNLPQINFDGIASAIGTLNLQNGLLSSDVINTTSGQAADSVFNFSGGTLQPLDNSIATIAWGSATASDNNTITLSGSEVMSSNDATGTGRTVHVYSPLGGNGVLTMVGNGTLILSGSATYANYSGELNINSGTVQIGSTTALPSSSGTVQVNGGKLDLNGFSPATGAVVLASGSIVNSGTAATLTGTSFTLEGGTVGAVLGGPSVPLAMAGPGLAVLGGANTYGGGTTVNGGTLQVNNGGSLGGSAGLLTINSGVLNLNGAGFTVGGISGPAGSVTGTSPATLTLAPATAQTYFGGIGGATSVTLNSHVVQTLAGSLSFTGATNVSSGTLSITGGTAFSNSPLVNVTSGAVLDVSQLAGGLSMTGGTLLGGRASSPAVDVNGNVNLYNSVVSFAGGAAAGTLTIGGSLSFNDSTMPFYPGEQIATTGNLALGGTDYVMPMVPLSAGTYTLLAWNGSLTGGTQDLAMAGVFGSSPRQNYSFGQSGDALTLKVSGTAANLVWTGAANSSWDNGVSANWYNTTSGSADHFYPADNVLFNDGAGTASNILINSGALGSVQPASMIVSNTAVNYTFSGTGSISGVTSIVKNGPGGLSINTSNSYIGGTFLNGGAVTAGAAGALGGGALTITAGTLNSNANEFYAGGTFLNGGLLNLGSSGAAGSGTLTIAGGALGNSSSAALTIAGNLPQIWNKGFTFVGGNPLNLGAGAVTLGVTPTVSVNSSTLTVGGNISGNFGLTLAGSGTLNLAGANGYTGATTIAGGVLQLGATSAIPTGANGGNVIFSNAAASAVLDLNGYNATINALSQPTPSTSNMVVNSLSGGTATLTVGNSNASSTFGGVLANNTGTGGVLSLTKTGAGTLTLLGANTYTGATTISSGGLQLGSGIPGQDGSIASSTSIVNNGSFIVSNVGPTTFTVPISGAGSLVQNSPSTLTLSGQNTVATLAFTNSGTITGGAISLTAGTTFANNAAGLSTLASPLSIAGVQAPNIWTSNSAGTLNIADSITDSNNHLYFFDGNYVMGAAGSITVSGFALILGGSNDTGSHTSNFLQTGGVISDSRPSAPASTFFVSQGGTTNYTMTGGTLLVTTGTGSVAYNGSGKNGYMTINGAGALASFAGLNIFGVSGGTGEVNLLNGTLQVDNLFTSAAASSTAYDIFDFSGGTLQPLDGGVSSAGIGSATAAQNVTIGLSGSGATLSSTDAGGIGRTVPVYANLTGSGALTTIGAGTFVFQGSNSGFIGQLAVNSGTVQIGSASAGALGSSLGSVLVNGGVLDINGNSTANPGAITLASGSIVDSSGTGALNATSYTLQSGTASAVLGGASASLNKTTSGLALLTAANNYGGPTTVNAGTLAVGASGTLGPGNVTVSPGAALDVSAWGPSGYSFSNMTLIAGRTSSFAVDINGSINMTNGTIAVVSPTVSGTVVSPTVGFMTISGNLNLNANVTYAYGPGDRIAVGGALSLSNPIYLLPTSGLSSGTYTLMTYNGGTPDPADDMSMTGIYQSGTRQTYTFDTSGGTAVTLTVVGNLANLFWNTTSGTWDIQTTPSWYNTGTSSADVFWTGDNVTFNDRPGGHAAIVNINAQVEPSTMTVSNTAVSYTMNGSGSINGSTALVKNGPGALTINTYNNYTGGTFLNSGLLNLGTNQALGAGPLTISGGSLDNTSGASLQISNTQNWNGNFTFVGTQPLTVYGPVALGATPTVTLGSSASLTAQGSISGNYGLTVVGGGTLNLAAANSYTGDTTIASGVLQMGTRNALPNGPGTGNVVFSNATASAVLDLNGYDTTINGLSQPNVSTKNVVLDNAGYNTLSVGINNASSTFGGVLADNNNGSFGQLNLQKVGAGVLVLINSNTYSGMTTVAGGTLQLGDGTPGHDGSINQTSGVTNNATVAFNFVAPQTVAAISGTGTLAQTGPGTVIMNLAGGATAGVLAIMNTGAISGGTITLQSPNGVAAVNAAWVSLANTATGTTTLSAPISLMNGKQDWSGNSAGTLNIEAPINQSSGNFFIDNGNYTMGSSGSIVLPSGASALVLGINGSTNFLQTGGLVYVDRTGNGIYFTQGTGQVNYTMTGGTVSNVGSGPGNGWLYLGYNAGTSGTLTVNGAAALIQTPNLDLSINSTGGSGTVYMANGTLQTDSIYSNNPSVSNFYFSGGTIQPIDSAVSSIGGNGFGEGGSGGIYNINITLSGTNAVMSSTDASGNPQIVPVSANLVGSGGIQFVGTGTLILGGSGAYIGGSNTYSGGSFVDSGTVQMGASAAFGAGALVVNGGTVDLAGFSPTINGLSGGSSGLIINLTGTNNSTLTVSQMSSTTFGGAIANGPTNSVALVLDGGQLTLTGTNTYSGGTNVEAGTLVIDSPASLLDGSSLTVGQGAAAIFGGPAAASPSVSAVPEPGPWSMLAAGAALFSLYRRRRK